MYNTLNLWWKKREILISNGVDELFRPVVLGGDSWVKKSASINFDTPASVLSKVV